MVPKGGEYESDTQNLDICETRKLYVSKSNFANMKATELKLHSYMVPKGGEYESDTQNLDICETRKLYVSKSNFAKMKATELKLHSYGSQGWRIRIRHSKFGHLRNS